MSFRSTGLTNCIISSSSLPGVTAAEGAMFTLTGFKLTSSAYYCILVHRFAYVQGGVLNFGTASLGHVWVVKHGEYFQTGDYTISGSTGSHITTSDSGLYVSSFVTCTLTGTPAFTVFAYALYRGIITSHDVTFSGACTGKRFAVEQNSAMGAGSSVTYFPGNASGSTDDTSIYNGVVLGDAFSQSNPVPSSVGGAFTTASSTIKYKSRGKVGWADVKITVTTVGGSASGWTTIVLPFTPANDTSMLFNAALISAGFQGRITGGSTTMSITRVTDGAFAIVDGTVLQGSWSGEIQ
jgi:hypothetical protein